jgi:hypothetical protein
VSLLVITNMSYSVTFLGTFNNSTSTEIKFSAVAISPCNSVPTHGSPYEIYGVQRGSEASFPPITVHRFFPVIITPQISCTHIFSFLFDAI